MNSRTLSNRFCLLLLILITLAGVGARIIGLSYDNLISVNHDEQIHLHTLQRIYEGIYSPREIWEGRKFLYVFYPWLSMYVVAAVFHLRDLVLGAYSFLAWWLLYLAGDGGDYLRGRSPVPPGLNPRQALYLGRLTIALIGAANIPLLYLVGKRLWDRRVGLLAAAFLALNGYHIANCHWLKNDILAAFFLTAAFYFIVRIGLGGKTRHYVFAAVFSALAVNTKHYAAPILASTIFAHFSGLSPWSWRGLGKRLVDRRLLIFGLIFLAAFAASYPLLYLDSDYLVSKFGQMAARTESEAMFGSLGAKARPRTFFQIRRDNLINFARFSWEMEAGIGPGVLLLGCGGIAAALWSRKKCYLLAASFPLVYLAAAVLVASPGVRYQDVIPLIPFIALLAAIFIRWVWPSGLQKQWLVSAGCGAAGIIILAPYLRMAVRMDYGYWERSARYFASVWADRHLPPGSSVLRESKTISLDDSRFQSARVRALWDRDVDSLAAAGADYLAVASRHENRALEETGLFGSDHPFGQFYLALPSRYDPLKEFDLGVVPYRGGGIKIWGLRRDFPLAPRGINSAILRRLQGDFSFSAPEILFPGPEGRCEGTTAFIVPGHDRIGRLIISSVPIPQLGIQVLNGPRPGTIRIRPGSEKLTEEFLAGEVRQFVLSPRAGFPYIDYSYRINVSSPWNSPCLVRLLTDPYRIGQGYFDLEDFGAAIPYLEQACRLAPDDWYPRALLSAACRRIGARAEAEAHRREVEEIFPQYRTARAILGDDTLSQSRWSEEFENWTGFSLEWLAHRAGRKWFADDLGQRLTPEGKQELEIGGFSLPAGDYRLLLRLDPAPGGGSVPATVQLIREQRVLGRWDLVPGAPEPEMTWKTRDLADGYLLSIASESAVLPRVREILVYPRAESLRARIAEYWKNL